MQTLFLGLEATDLREKLIQQGVNPRQIRGKKKARTLFAREVVERPPVALTEVTSRKSRKHTKKRKVKRAKEAIVTHRSKNIPPTGIWRRGEGEDRQAQA